MNHHKHDISNDCMHLVIYWVEGRAIDVPHLLAKQVHYAIRESKIKKDKFTFQRTQHKIIDLYRPSVQTRPFKTYIRRSKPKKP